MVEVRQAAKRTKIGQLDCLIRRQTPVRGTEETVYRFRPSTKDAGHRLEDLDSFIRELDGFAGAVITSIDLEPTKKPEGTDRVETWDFEVDLTTYAE